MEESDLHHLVVYGRSAPKLASLVRSLGFMGKVTPCITPDEARASVPEAEILLAARLPNELYPLLERCRWIQSLNAGIEDLTAAPVPAGIVVTRVVGLFGGYISEYTLGYMLAHTLKMRHSATRQAERRWEHFYIDRLEGKRLGVAGLGSIGGELVRRATALGVQVRGLSRGGGEVTGVQAVFTPDRTVEFCTELDFLAITLPFTPETDGLFGREALAALAPGAVVINAGRGRVVQEEALLSGLRSGHLGGAVLDVFVQEPLPPEHPFWTEPGVTVTAHVSGPTTPEDIARYFMANYVRFRLGEPMEGLVLRERGY